MWAEAAGDARALRGGDPRVPAGAARRPARVDARARRHAPPDRPGGPAGLYRGPVAEAICAVSPLTLDDLAVQHADWVEPLRKHYRGVEVCEIPPNGQGVAALQALGILAELDHTGGSTLDRVHLQAEAMKLAFADAERHVHDGPLPARYLDDDYLAERRAQIDPRRAGAPEAGALQPSGTVYLCAVDEQRNACSLIQSVYHAFGSQVVAPGTGVALQNRGHCFTLEEGHPNRLAPGKRPYHTIIPGLLLRDGALLGPMGVMGGHMQPQGHLQLVSHLVDRGLGPQAALDEPRWRLDTRRPRRVGAGARGAVPPARARARGARPPRALRPRPRELRRRPGDPRARGRADRRQRAPQGRRRAGVLGARFGV